MKLFDTEDGEFCIAYETSSLKEAIRNCIVTLLVFIIFILVGIFVEVNNLILDLVFTGIRGISLLCFLIAILDLSLYFDDDVDEGERLSEKEKNRIKTYPLQEIVYMVQTEPIIEIIAAYRNTKLKIGSSAENIYGSDGFKNVMYYVKDQEFSEIEDFQNELKKLFGNRLIPICEIDGLAPEDGYVFNEKK